MTTSGGGLDLAEAARQLRLQLEWASGTFWLGMVFAEQGHERRGLCAIAQEEQGFLALQIGSPASAGSILATVLGAEQPLWLDLAAPEASKVWRDAAWSLVAGLNERRERLRRAGHALVIAGPTWLKTEIREAAPDLWSIVEMRLELDPPQEVLSRRSWEAPGVAARRQLWDFTVSAFSASELRRLVHFTLPEIRHELPSQASMAQLVDAVLDAAIRRGMLDRFIEAVKAERPRRAGELATLQAEGAASPALSPVVDQVQLLSRRTRARFHKELEGIVGTRRLDPDRLPELVEEAKARGATEEALRVALDRALAD